MYHNELFGILTVNSYKTNGSLLKQIFIVENNLRVHHIEFYHYVGRKMRSENG